MKVDTKYEQFGDHAKSVKLKTLNEIAKSLCQIKLKSSRGTGFFIKINANKTLYMLVSANHVTRHGLVREKKDIEIITDVGNIKQKIKLDNKERKIVLLQEKGYDISAVEIIDNDNLKDKVKFLDYDVNCNIKNYYKYLNADAFILHHPNGVEDLEFSSGKIVVIKGEKHSFQHTLDTETGSSGSPILLIENENANPKVLAVQTSAETTNKNNNGVFIDVLIKELI